jgi:hypothetical protein
MCAGQLLDKRDYNAHAEPAHRLQNALVRAHGVLRQIIGEESGLLRGDTFAIERRDLRAPLLDQLQRLAAASLGTREHPFRVRSSTGLLITSDSHYSSQTQHEQCPRIALDVHRRGKDARWIVKARVFAEHLEMSWYGGQKMQQ